MKKISLFAFATLLVASQSLVFATTVNLPSAPQAYERKKVVQKPYDVEGSTSTSVGSSSLDELTMSMLKAAERRDNTAMQNYFKQLSQKEGVTGITQPQIMAKRTPHCPPIKMELNGRTLSGSLCAKTGYVYNGKLKEIGYCK